MSGGSKAPKRRNKKRGSRVVVPAGDSGPSRLSRMSLGGGQQEGTLFLKREEFIEVIYTGASPSVIGVGITHLHPQSFPWLKGFAQSFDLYQWRSMSVEYRPCVGSTTEGFVVFGVNWGHTESPKKVDDVYACTPNFETAVWQRVPRVTLPANKLQLKKWYDAPTQSADNQPGTLMWWAEGSSSGKKFGHLFITYSIVLSGTRASA